MPRARCCDGLRPERGLSVSEARRFIVQGARLGGALRRRLARSADSPVWRAPEVLGFEPWLALLSLPARLGGEAPFADGFVLSRAQAHALWLASIARDHPLHGRQLEQLATRARDADGLIADWQLARALQAHAGGLPAFDAFLAWQARVRARCRELGALMPADVLVAAAAARLRDPLAEFAGFGRVGPCAGALGIPLPTATPAPMRLPALRAFATREEEYLAACDWALATRRAGVATVAVVLPDAAAIEACAALVTPHEALRGAGPLAFAGGSVGSLGRLPMVLAALNLLALARGLAPLEAAALVQSPYVAARGSRPICSRCAPRIGRAKPCSRGPRAAVPCWRRACVRSCRWAPGARAGSR